VIAGATVGDSPGGVGLFVSLGPSVGLAVGTVNDEEKIC
jgi:hypothetical protein